MSDQQTRRDFVTTAGAALAPAVLSAQNVNSELQLAWIGTGGRGYYLMDMLYKGNAKPFKVVATCDTYDGNLARGKDRIQTMGGNTPKATKDYREILADKSIDAVVIATPEHLHYPMAIAALKAGKNIYLEKPLAHTIEEGAEIVKLAEKVGKTVQVGTQNRSNSLYQKAKEMVSQGMIGEVHYVRAFWYRNSLPDNPAWRYNIPADANEQNTDWPKFLGAAPKRPFHKGRYYQWRLYWDY
jgi:predicted dehydrogenase